MKRQHKLLYSSIVLLLTGTFFASWFFVGIEITYREEITDYDPFIKKKPSFKFLFLNTAQCGECDLRPFDLIGPENRAEFLAYCRARRGIDDIMTCYRQLESEQPPPRFSFKAPQS